MKKTVLHPAHIALNAKMVDFGGWDMPIHYTSQIEEHNAVRQNIGMFDVSHMQIVDISGNPKPFLEYLIANDVNKLNQNQALYSCMLNHDGGIIDDLIVYNFGDFYRLVINAGCADKDIEWINEIAKEFDVNIKVRTDLAMIALQGYNAMDLFDDNIKSLKPFYAQLDKDKDICIARTGYTGEKGIEIMLPATKAIDTWNDFIAKGVKPCGLGARDTLRLEAGMNLYGQDMNEQTKPIDCGLEWTISISDRDFIGKNALVSANQQYQFLGLILESGGILRAHQKVIFNDKEGEITSGTYSPTMKKSIAMAKLPVEVNIGNEVNVYIRGKLLPAKVVKLPFVRNNKVIC